MTIYNTTPCTIDLDPGTYTVTADYGGKIQSKSATIQSGETTSVFFEFTAPDTQTGTGTGTGTTTGNGGSGDSGTGGNGEATPSNNNPPADNKSPNTNNMVAILLAAGLIVGMLLISQ